MTSNQHWFDVVSVLCAQPEVPVVVLEHLLFFLHRCLCLYPSLELSYRGDSHVGYEKNEKMAFSYHLKILDPAQQAHTRPKNDVALTSI